MYRVLNSIKLSKQTDNIEYLFTKGFLLSRDDLGIFNYQMVIRHASMFKDEPNYANLEIFCKNGLIKNGCDTMYESGCRNICDNSFYEYAPDPRTIKILLKYDTDEIVKKSIENNDYLRTKLETRYLPIYHMIFLKKQIEAFKECKFLLEAQVLEYLV